MKTVKRDNEGKEQTGKFIPIGIGYDRAWQNFLGSKFIFSFYFVPQHSSEADIKKNSHLAGFEISSSFQLFQTVGPFAGF